MKAFQKFENRLRELGLYEEWCNIGNFGKVGTEKKGGIHILVHEGGDDKYTEFVFPPMAELEKNDDFRSRALEEFCSWDDYEFIGKLYAWAKDYQSHDCPLYPVDVFFLVDNPLYADFEDDTEEWCPHCDTCVDLDSELKVQRCPNCGKWIAPCSVCPLQDCSSKCPLERLAILLNCDN